MIELIGAIAGMRRSSEPNWLLTCLAPHVLTIWQGTPNVLGIVVLLLVNERGPLTGATAHGNGKRGQLKVLEDGVIFLWNADRVNQLLVHHCWLLLRLCIGSASWTSDRKAVFLHFCYDMLSETISAIRMLAFLDVCNIFIRNIIHTNSTLEDGLLEFSELLPFPKQGLILFVELVLELKHEREVLCIFF